MSVSTIEGSMTVSTTELSVISGTSTLQSSTTAGIYQLWLDLNALASGDRFELLFKEKVQSSGTQRVFHRELFSGLQPSSNYASVSILVKNGFDVTLKKLSGTDRAIGYSLRYVS
jgi:hypothetical protein